MRKLSNYFIHTIELIKAIDIEKYKELISKCNFNSKNYKWIGFQNFINLEYIQYGIRLEIRKCTNNDIKNYSKPFLITVIVNMNMLIYNMDLTKQIHSTDEFDEAIETLFDIMDKIDSDFQIGDIDESNLSRLDIARDVHGIPENIIKEVNKMLYRIPMYDGYTNNKSLEENCPSFMRENSFNIENNSQGFEFVVYNKHQAALDNCYYNKCVDYFKDTLRIELRCKRKYIRQHFLEKNLKRTLKNAYVNMSSSVSRVYNRLFKFPTNLCHLESKMMIKYLFDETGNKKARCRRMVTLLDELDKYPKEDLQTALDNVYPSDKRQNNIKKHYERYGVSPITMRGRPIPFIQSLDSLLGFYPPTDQEIKLYLMAKKKYGKSVFFQKALVE